MIRTIRRPMSEEAAKPKPQPEPKPPPPPDHTPVILELIKHLGSQKRPTGMKRTKDGMQVIFEGEAR
jgi:hypothetical protein